MIFVILVGEGYISVSNNRLVQWRDEDGLRRKIGGSSLSRARRLLEKQDPELYELWTEQGPLCYAVLLAQEGEQCGFDSVWSYCWIQAYANHYLRLFEIHGGERADLEQIFRIGLARQISNYDVAGAKYLTYTYVGFKNMTSTALRAMRQHKRSFYRQAIPLDAVIVKSGGQFVKVENCIVGVDGREFSIDENLGSEALAQCGLSSLEMSVVVLKSQDLSYEEMAARLGTHTKAIDNALGRVKRKIGKAVRKNETVDLVFGQAVKGCHAAN